MILYVIMITIQKYDINRGKEKIRKLNKDLENPLFLFIRLFSSQIVHREKATQAISINNYTFDF